MNLVLMKHQTDCEVAAIATACQVSYDDAKSALGWRKLPGGLENPAFGNPLNLHRALIKLGFWKKNVTLTELLTGQAAPHRTVVLLKQSILMQHWVVYAGLSGDYIGFWWGDSSEPKFFPKATISKWFTAAGPVNEAFQVYKASIWRITWEKIRNLWRKK